MKKITTLLFAAGISVSSLTAQSNINSQLWSDPTFVSEFLGSYGFLAGAEPRISDEEKEALRNLIDLIKASPKAAIQALEPQITQTSSAAFDFILANLYFQDGNLAKAEQYYGNAVVKHPDFRRAYKNLGLVQVQGGDFNKAIKTISKAMELGEVDGRSYGLLGYGYLTQEKYYPAEAAYRQAILMQPEVTDWKVGLARCLLETQRYADAIALFDTLLIEEPNNADYWLLQGNAYLGKGESLNAAKNLEVVRRMGAADLGTLTLLGDIYMNNNSADLALEAYLAAADQATAVDSQALLRAAELLTRSGNYEQSKTIIARIREKIQLAEGDDLKLLTVEAKIARAEGNDEAAVELLTKIVERDALNGEALIELANFYADTGDMAKAITRFQQAEKIEAHERDALVAHAQARVRNGDYKEALPLLRRALQLKSDSNLEDYAQRVEKAARSQS
jgi:tetratricopeptide (TPR) repeat protein